MDIRIKDDDTVVIDGVTFVKQQNVGKRIDWTKMPKGTWVEVTMDPEGKWYRRQLCATQSSPTKYVTLDMSGDALGTWLHIRLIEQPEVTFWPGGECPVPEGVVVELHLRSGEIEDHLSEDVEWQHGSEIDGGDIIGYRILGVAEGWES